jgi:hypothetical protein
MGLSASMQSMLSVLHRTGYCKYYKGGRLLPSTLSRQRMNGLEQQQLSHRLWPVVLDQQL